MKNTYKNRYGDVFTFIEDENHDVLWKGNFEFCRIGYPNDYTRAYEAYLEDNKHVQSLMSLNQFKNVVHHYDDETLEYDYPKYIKMIDCLRDEIEMADPSGGPYLSRGMSLDMFGFKGFVIEDFKKIEKGYKIITKKCPTCNQANGHKMSCPTEKVTIFYNQMDKEVHQNNSNLNK